MSQTKENRPDEEPMSDADFANLIRKAAVRVAQFDEMDGHELSRLPAIETLKAARAAIEAGIRNSDITSVADGYVMLIQAEERLGKPQEPHVN